MFHNNIPVIDLSPLFTGDHDNILSVSQRLREVYTTIGFAYLINHHISEEIIEAAFIEAKKFHDLPLEEKMMIKQNDCFRGYVPINASQLKVSTLGSARKPNQLDAFVMAFEPNADHPEYRPGVYLEGENQWPTSLPRFKEKLYEYRDAMLMLASNLLKAFSLAFGMSEDSLKPLFSPPSFFLRLQHYPEQPELIPEDQFGIAPHTDYGFFTLLSQNTVEGLEVRDGSGEWIAVPALPGALVLNTSDMLKRMSNNLFFSTPHRVVNRSGKERFSIPFFFEPNMHSMIEVLPSCITEDNPAQYPPIKYGEYLMDRIQGNYNLGKRS